MDPFRIDISIFFQNNLLHWTLH